MSKFSADKGFLHLLFANEDEFYLKSLACLDLNGSVRYELQKDYDGLYFITWEKDEYRLKLSGETACKIYREAGNNGLIARIFSLGGNEEKTEEVIRFPEHQTTTFEERMFKILKQEKDQAFVFDVESFTRLFQREDAGRLLELQKKAQGKNIILIHAPASVNGITGYMEDPDSIFRSDLFPGLMESKKGRMEKLQLHIQNNMGGCCHFLNCLDRENIRNMIRRTLLEKNDLESDILLKADDYADFIYIWYHSEKLRKKTGGILPENKKWLISELRQTVSDREQLKKLNFWIDLLESKETEWYAGSDLLSVIEEEYEPDLEETYLYMYSNLRNQFDMINMPIAFQADEEVKDRVDRIRRELLIPRMGQKEIDKDERIQDYLESFAEAVKRQDHETAKHLLGAIEYEFCTAPGESEEVVRKKRKYWKNILSASSQVFKKKNMTKRYEEYIQKFEQRIPKLDAKIEKTAAEDLMRIPLEQERVQAKNKLKHYNNVRTANELARNQMISSIEQLLHGIYNIDYEADPEENNELREIIDHLQEQIHESVNEDMVSIANDPLEFEVDMDLDLNMFLE